MNYQKLKSLRNEIISLTCCMLLIIMLILPLIWVEVNYKIDCSTIKKFNDDYWYQQSFEVKNKGMISGYGQGSEYCNILFNSSILTHIRIGLIGWSY